MCPKVEADGESFRFLGIIAKNREEWAISAIATMRSSVTIVPFYESLGAEAISYVVNQTELTTMCCDEKFIDMILKLKATGKAPRVTSIVCYDKPSEEKVRAAADKDVKMYWF